MRIYAKNPDAQSALQLLRSIQSYFKSELLKASSLTSQSTEFKAVEWLRDNGSHGGGERFEATFSAAFL